MFKLFSARNISATRSFSHQIKNLAVIGAGQMGTGIGIVGSRVAGLNVNFVDPSAGSLERSQAFVNNWC